MGGRVAMRVADEEGVEGVLGLAPWLPPDEPFEQLAGRRLLVVHGLRDRITSAGNAKTFVDAARPVTRSATYIGLRRSGHTMLRRANTWNRLTCDFVLSAGLGVEPRRKFATALSSDDAVI